MERLSFSIFQFLFIYSNIFLMVRRFKWKINTNINQLLIELEAARLVFSGRKTNPKVEENLHKSALLKSAIYSARIEGLPDTLSSPKQDSQNLVRAYGYVYSQRSPRELTLRSVKRMHKLAGFSGQWRSEPWAIFNEGGQVVHMAPAHFKLPGLMEEYKEWVNKLREPVGIIAAVAQFGFEKIHPFADGNGRVGRLVSAFILAKNGYEFAGLAPFEEYIDKNRGDYYAALEPSSDATDFIEFFLDAVVTQARGGLEELGGEVNRDESLLPRRREILEVIRDHPNCSFDFIARRFMAIKSSALHYDLAQLMKAGLVRKLGGSRGVVYRERVKSIGT